MQPIPYSIYIDNRPLRVAFLVDPNKSNLQQIEIIIVYNQSKWGGRYNPIVFTDGNTIRDEWWDFLRDYDPDIIKSLIPINDDLVEKIESRLSPYSLETPREYENESHWRINTLDNGLNIRPTPQNLAKLSKSYIINSKLVLFDLDHTEDEILKQFIRCNFGTYSIRNAYLDSLDQEQKVIFPITNYESLATALIQLSTSGPYIYPIQNCSLPNNFRDAKDDQMKDFFTVFIGDGPIDLINHWNRIFSIRTWKRTNINHIWLSTDIAKNMGIRDALKKWLGKLIDPGGITNQEAQFVSFSLRDSDLKEFADILITKNAWIRKTTKVLTETEIPSLQPNGLNMYLYPNMELHRATANEETIVINEPEVSTKIRTDEHWMTDVYIQYRPERYPNINEGKDFWWQLPRRNILAHRIFNKPSRVNSNSIPSVLMRSGETNLNIKLPDDESIFWYLIIEENTPFHPNDPRNNHIYQPFHSLQLSDKGKYLAGFLDIFSGLSFAYDIFSQRYWRRMFEKYQKISADGKSKQAILNKLKKMQKQYGPDFLTNPNALDILSNNILQLSKNQASTGKEIPIEVFIEEAESELKDFNSSEGEHTKLTFEKEDLMKYISDLIGLNIFLLGIRTHCPLCGFANWHHLDEAQQILRCKGCGYNYPMRPEERWYYKLNNLIQAGCCEHGLIPVILVLGQLLHDSRKSFIFTSSLDLYEKQIIPSAFRCRDNPLQLPTCPHNVKSQSAIGINADEDTIIAKKGDLDIVCIKDGKFIIGEVKQSNNLFAKSDFNKMAKIAEKIKPDILLFSSLEKQNKLIEDNIERIKETLEPLGIETIFYQLECLDLEPHFFYPVR